MDPWGLAKKAKSKFALVDGAGSTAQEMADSLVNGGSRAGQQAVREELFEEVVQNGGVFTCWRCGQTTKNSKNMHLGHRNEPTSKGGN